MRNFFSVYFPKPVHKAILFALFALMLAYLVYVPIGIGTNMYQVFHFAAENLRHGGDPYLSVFPGLNYFKYGPFFLMFPLIPLSVLPVTAGAVIWQLISLLVYAIGVIAFFSAIAKDDFKSTIAFAVVFSFVLIFDLSANGVYCQSNTFLVGGVLIGLALYARKRYLWAGVVFAYMTDMKLLPIAFALLLATERNPKYILSLGVSLLVFLCAPFLFFGFEGGRALYESWIRVLSIDGAFAYGEWTPYYLGVKAFLESNFGVVLNRSLSVLMVLFGALFAVVFYFKKRPYTPRVIMQMTALLFPYLLLFNTRTESPSLILMAPVYGIFLYGAFYNKNENGRAKTILSFIVLGVAFFITSLSKTDLTKGTFVNDASWKYNLRTLGMAIAFIWALASLFSARVANTFLPNEPALGNTRDGTSE